MPSEKLEIRWQKFGKEFRSFSYSSDLNQRCLPEGAKWTDAKNGR